MGDFALTGFFVMGSIMVIVATFMYGLPDKTAVSSIASAVLPKAVDKSHVHAHSHSPASSKT